MKVDGVDILPDPVVRGKPATFKISAATGDVSLSPRLCFSFSLASFLVGVFPIFIFMLSYTYLLSFMHYILFSFADNRTDVVIFDSR